MTREQINAEVWLTNAPLPLAICQQHRDTLPQYGFYRRLNDERLEFISFCNEEAGRMISVTPTSFETILNATLPEVR